MSALALQAAIFAALSADAEITAIAGPDKFFDGRPDRKDLPYAVFGEWQVRDWSTATETGTEHRFDVDIWSEGHGRREAAALAEAVRGALHDRDLALVGWRLVNLRHHGTRTAREPKSRLYRARLSFRAVVETDA